MDLINKSIEYLSAVRSGESVESIKSDIAKTENLDQIKDDSNLSKTFWCNLYNSRVQELINKNGYNLETTADKLRLLYLKRITVSGKRLSLQRIEHEILRKGKLTYGLGYIPNPRPHLVRSLATPKSLDPRIHFLLNCGAESCPLIRPIEPGEFNNVANIAAEEYISKNTEVNEDTIRVPRIFLWYIGDFGGWSGIKSTVQQYADINFNGRNLRFKKYSWAKSEDPYK